MKGGEACSMLIIINKYGEGSSSSSLGGMMLVFLLLLSDPFLNAPTSSLFCYLCPHNHFRGPKNVTTIVTCDQWEKEGRAWVLNEVYSGYTEECDNGTTVGITGLSLEESGPRFLEDFGSSTHPFTSRLGTVLRCGAHGQPHPLVQWVDKDGFPVGNVTGLREVDPNPSSGTMRFLPFSPESYRPDIHSTGYRCKAKNSVGTIISPEISVRAVLDTSYSIELRDSTVVKGNTGILKCSVPPDLHDLVTVTSWVMDTNVNIYPNFQTGKWLMLPSGELYIFNAEKADEGKLFACRTLHKLTNEAKTSGNGRIIVKDPEGPMSIRMLVERERRIRVRAGEETHVPCLAEGNPPPTYTWFRDQDGLLLPLYSMDPSTTSKGPSATFTSPMFLHFLQIRPEDGGTYICRSNNSHSADQVSVNLQVYVPLRTQLSPGTQVVDVGRGTSIRCLVSGGPLREIEWYKDGERLVHGGNGNKEQPTSASSKRYSINPRELLKLPSIHPQDAGMYQCLAKNEISYAQDAAQIRLGSILPELVYRFSEQTIQPGPSVSLKCTAVGNPPPQFIWMLDGFPLPESERFVVGQYVTIHDNVISHVNITHAREEDGGLYSCQARNAMGTVTHSARLNIYGPPFVRPVPPVKAIAGKSLIIQCPVSGYPIETISWEKGGSLLPSTRLQRVFPNGTLVLDHLQKMDEGLFTCTAKGRGGQGVSSRDIHVRVVVPPKIMPFQFMNNLLREGMRAAVSCQLLEGDRPIDLIWEFEGRPITSAMSNGITIRIPDEYSSTLVIDSLSSKHNGVYTCIAENSAGKEQYSSELTVQIPPKWVLEPRDQAALSGHSASFQCQAEGHPAPTISWKRASSRSTHLSQDFRDITITHGTPFPNGSLRFESLRKEDEGSYLCEARNGVGVGGLSKVVFLKVNAPPQFSQREETISIRSGEKAILQCRGKGDLPIEVQWNNKHGVVGAHSNHRYAFREQELSEPAGVLSEMIITAVDRSDGGQYSCRATNSFGSDYTSITLNVQEPPEQPINVRVLEVGSRSVGISWLENFNGNSPIINFIIQSKFPSETWTEAEVEEFAVPASQTTAVVEGLIPSTTYHLRVLGQNGVGFSPPSEVVQITTTEESPEGPPLDIMVEALSSTKLRIHWAPPERTLWHGQILGYYLGFRELSLALAEEMGDFTSSGVHSHTSKLGDLHGYHFKTVEVGPDFGGEAELDNLVKFARYAIVVQAFNAKGAGPSSVPLVGTTLQDVPSLPPEKVECRPVSPQSLHFTWDPPPLEGRHGIIQGYKVEVEPILDGSGDHENEIQTKITAEREIILHALRKWTNYSMVVKAFTTVGEGDERSLSQRLVCRTDEDVPSPPADAKVLPKSKRSLLISWRPPSYPNGEVLKYTIYLRVGDGTKVEKKILPFTDTSYEWTGLKDSQTYEIWVSSTTGVGEGQATSRVKATPTSKVGAKIASFGTLIEIPWKRELSLRCLVVGVPEPNVQWTFNGARIHSGGRKELSNTNTNLLLVKDINLEDSGNYSCSAHNSHGNDQITYQVKVQTPPKPPILQVTELGYTDAKLVWGKPHDGGSKVKGYLINYRREGGEWEEIEVGPRVTGHTLGGLLCGNTYLIFITAYNKIGTGEKSDTLTRSTKGHAPISPRIEDGLKPSHEFNHSSIVIRLDPWTGKGCPILRFMIEYRSITERSWMRIPSELNGEAKSYTLTGLHPLTRYEVRITAGNDAGETSAKYEFSTGPMPTSSSIGANVGGSDLIHSSGESTSTSSSSSLNTAIFIIFPSILSLLAVTGVIGFLLYVRRKRILLFGTPSSPLSPSGGGGMGRGGESSSGKPGLDDFLHGRRGVNMYEGPGGGGHYTLVKNQYPDLTAAAYAAKNRESGGSDYVDDVCPYATFQLPENPPTRPVFNKGQGGGGMPGDQFDTLYNVGNVYGGPYHPVQSMATLPLREAEYLQYQQEDSVDSEVRQILAAGSSTLQRNRHLNQHHHPPPPPHHPDSPSQYHQPIITRQQQYLLQEQMGIPVVGMGMGTYGRRGGNNRSSVPLSSDPCSSSSNTSTDDGGSNSTSSPAGRRGGGGGGTILGSVGGGGGGIYASGRKSKSKSSIQSGSGGTRLRSSSGYSSSHTEETSFTQPPSRYSEGNYSDIIPPSSEPGGGPVVGEAEILENAARYIGGRKHRGSTGSRGSTSNNSNRPGGRGYNINV